MAPREIGNGAGDAQNAVVATRTQPGGRGSVREFSRIVPTLSEIYREVAA